MRRRRMRMRKRRAAIKTLCSVLGSVALGCAVWLALILAFLFDQYEPPGPPKIVESHGMSYTLEEWQQLQEEKAAYEAEEAARQQEELECMQKVQEAGNSRISETRKLTEIRSLDWSGEESYMLAKIAMAEAEGEGTEGKALVILVVLNRAWDEEFPDSIEEVISQDGQFTSYWDGRYDEAAPDEECWEALRMIQVDKWDESQGATYFRSSSDESTWHSRNLQELFTHGNHTFYKEADK